MNRDPSTHEWLRVVRYFKQRARNELKDQARQLARTGSDPLKSPKLF
jgi:hypothetical protein